MLLIGLTGNFGMGKSYVLSVFRDLGAVTLDSDRIVEILLGEEEVVDQIRSLLGGDVVGADHRLNKKAVADIIFHDPAAKKSLEDLLHPMVFARMNDFIGRIKDKNRIVIVEVPLLFEGDYANRYSKVITVFTAMETAVGRLLASGLSREEAAARLNSQLPIDIKKKRADFTIDNNRTKEETRKQVEAIYELLLHQLEKVK